MLKIKNKKKQAVLLFVAIACFLFQSLSTAAQKPVSVRAGITTGYDNNTGLNADRKGDWFVQETAAVTYKTVLSKNIKLRLGYDVLNDNYFEAEENSFLYQDVGAGLDFLLSPTTLWENDYDFIYIYFPDNDTVTSYTHRVRTGLKQKINKTMMALGGVSFSNREFDERLARGANGALGAEELNDERYSADAGLRIQLNKKIGTQFGFVYDRNDSNDTFHDYYDYNNYKWSSVTVVQWAKNWRSHFRFSYEKREYDARPLVDNSSELEEDDIFSATASLYYSFRPNWSLGAVHTYREKDSNEPSQGYSGSITTLGLYISF